MVFSVFAERCKPAGGRSVTGSCCRKRAIRVVIADGEFLALSRLRNALSFDNPLLVFQTEFQNSDSLLNADFFHSKSPKLLISEV